MNEYLNVKIMTPYGLYFQNDKVEYLEVRSDFSVLGILPNHAPLVSTLIISPMVIKIDGKKTEYAITGGVIHVKKDEVVLLVNAIESADEIDLERAKASKERAEARLKEKSDEINAIRASASHARALNRINVKLH